MLENVIKRKNVYDHQKQLIGKVVMNMKLELAYFDYTTLNSTGFEGTLDEFESFKLQKGYLYEEELNQLELFDF